MFIQGNTVSDWPASGSTVEFYGVPLLLLASLLLYPSHVPGQFGHKNLKTDSMAVELCVWTYSEGNEFDKIQERGGS